MRQKSLWLGLVALFKCLVFGLPDLLQCAVCIDLKGHARAAQRAGGHALVPEDGRVHPLGSRVPAS